MFLRLFNKPRWLLYITLGSSSRGTVLDVLFGRVHKPGCFLYLIWGGGIWVMVVHLGLIRLIRLGICAIDWILPKTQF